MPGLAHVVHVVVPLTIMTLVVHALQIESEALRTIMPVATAGALALTFIRGHLRLPLILGVTLGSLVALLGAGPGLLACVVGGVLLGICHLPAPNAVRIALLLGAGAALAYWRSGGWSDPGAAFWGIVASAFMFRLIVYVYDRRHGDPATSIWQRLSYFFLLPNLCFPLFPVIDYRTFCRTYDTSLALADREIGVRWMTRGLIHLFAYRVVYTYGVLSPDEVATTTDLVQYLIANYALYLRISGIFHLAIGMLRVFGFALPETHQVYFLAQGVTDMWRRINIYWKDFLLKVFFRPLFFRLRRIGNGPAMFCATLCVAVISWALHSYQYFWLTGRFPIEWQDIAFWGTLGIIMASQVAWEQRNPRARGPRARQWSVATGLTVGVRIVGTFAFMTILWSLWGAESWGQWLRLWSVLPQPSVEVLSATVLWTAAAIIACSAALLALPANRLGSRVGSRVGTWLALGSLLCVTVAAQPERSLHLGADAARVLNALREQRFNRADIARMEDGYYEEILGGARPAMLSSDLSTERPADWPNFADTGALRPTTDLRIKELRPSASVLFKGAPFHVNRWGLRDKDYDLEKPAHSVRIAVFGTSHVAGSGVANGENFESLVEVALNQQQPNDVAYELLNFAVSGYTPLQRLESLRRMALRFSPDVVFWFAQGSDVRRVPKTLARAYITPSIEIEDGFLLGLLDRVGAHPDMDEDELIDRLRKHSGELIDWIHRQFAAVCRENAVRPVWIFLPEMNKPWEKERALLLASARNNGLDVIDLGEAYTGSDVAKIRVAPWDHHPNFLGHQVIAEALLDEIQVRPERIQPRADEPARADDTGPVVVVVIDTLRADHLPCYGYQRSTAPFMCALAADGTLYENAYTPRTETVPAIASILTGLYPHRHGVRRNSYVLPARFETLAEKRRSEGFRTGAFVSSFLMIRDFSGFDQGFDVYDDAMTRREELRENFERDAASTVDRAIAWLRSGSPRAFLFLHLIEPHGPYDPPPPFAARFASSDKDDVAPLDLVPRYQRRPGFTSVSHFVDAYDAEIAAADAQVGRVIDTLRDLGWYGDATIVVTADHGESMGEDGLWFRHGDSVGDAEARVPLIVKRPNQTRGERTGVPVSLVDLGRFLGGAAKSIQRPTPFAVTELFRDRLERVAVHQSHCATSFDIDRSGQAAPGACADGTIVEDLLTYERDFPVTYRTDYKEAGFRTDFVAGQRDRAVPLDAKQREALRMLGYSE